MASDKKSFIFYADWKSVFDELPNEEAGMLIKHLLAYVNDEKPISENLLIRAVFANIKTTLKRDLCKYEKIREKRSLAGKASVNKRQQVLTSVESVGDVLCVSDSDSDSDSGREEKEKTVSPKKTLKERNQKYMVLARYLSRIIRTNINIRHTPQQLSSWTNDIRQLEEGNKIEFTRIQKALEFYEKHIGEQYTPVIQSGSSLKEKFGSLENNMSAEKFPKKKDKPKKIVEAGENWFLNDTDNFYYNKQGERLQQ